jgi:uncharacterized membrane protein
MCVGFVQLMRILKYTLLTSAVIFISLQFVHYPQMPENVAIHFNMHGEINGWLPKNANLILSCFIFILVNSVFAGVPHLLKTTPSGLINVPNKDYWLDPRNKDRMINILSGHMYFIGIVTNLFLGFLKYQIFRFNIKAIDDLPMISVIPFLMIYLGTIINLFVRLNKST